MEVIVLVVAALLWGALFIGGVLAAAIVEGSKVALGLGLLSAGLSFLTFAVQLPPSVRDFGHMARWFACASWVVAALAAAWLMG